MVAQRVSCVSCRDQTRYLHLRTGASCENPAPELDTTVSFVLASSPKGEQATQPSTIERRRREPMVAQRGAKNLTHRHVTKPICRKHLAQFSED